MVELAELRDGKIVIEVPIDCLENAARLHPDLYRFQFDERGNEDETRIQVTNAELFAAEIVRQLNREDERGETDIHRLLDKALSDACDNGAEGIFIKGID